MKPKIFDENNNWIAGQRRPFFKYLKKEHAHSMLEFGRIRIGTLYNFRNIEQYDAARADSSEGIHNVNIFIEQPVHQQQHEASVQYYLDQLGVAVSYSSYTRIVGSIHSQNCWIYSFSDRLSWSMASDFSADSCIIIWDIKELVERMIASDELDVQFIELGPIRYVDNDHDVRKLGRVLPSFIKESRFAPQDEWRLVMPPAKSEEIEPKIIELGSLERICSVIGRNSFSQKACLGQPRFASPD